MEEERTDIRYTPSLSPAVQLALAVKWDAEASPEHALLAVKQQATDWLRTRPDINNDIHNTQVGARFAEIILEGMSANIQAARAEGSGSWTEHLRYFFKATQGPLRRGTVTQWIQDMAAAARPFRDLAEPRPRHILVV